jgi:CRP/FNR family transcriptional regulator, cyclic AMP receptor protein
VIDASGFFQYPSEPAADAPDGLLGATSVDDWSTLLSYTETVRFRPGEVVLRAGDDDRALYLLVDGRLESPGGTVEPVSAIGEGAFLDGAPRAVTLRALTSGELLRLGWDAFEALAAREPRLARELLIDLGRLLTARLRTADVGWTG